MGRPKARDGWVASADTANTLRYLVHVEKKKPKGEIIFFESYKLNRRIFFPRSRPFIIYKIKMYGTMSELS
jgi:hypothetical protein